MKKLYVIILLLVANFAYSMEKESSSTEQQDTMDICCENFLDSLNTSFYQGQAVGNLEIECLTNYALYEQNNQKWYSTKLAYMRRRHNINNKFAKLYKKDTAQSDILFKCWKSYYTGYFNTIISYYDTLPALMDATTEDITQLKQMNSTSRIRVKISEHVMKTLEYMINALTCRTMSEVVTFINTSNQTLMQQ